MTIVAGDGLGSLFRDQQIDDNILTSTDQDYRASDLKTCLHAHQNMMREALIVARHMA